MDTDKTDGSGWTISFGSWGHHKSSLMGWSTGTQDTFYNVSVHFGRLSDAIKYATAMGWGYDVYHPHHRWHT